MSYLEIYNETIRDLLEPENTNIRIHEDKNVSLWNNTECNKRGVCVTPLREEIVNSPQRVFDVIDIGEGLKQRFNDEDQVS